MNLASFTDNFEHLANAPDGVKRIRELILHLAISGRLVEQRDSEEPASMAVSDATELRDRYQAELKIRKRKPAGPLRSEEIAFSVPESWAWSDWKM